MPDSKSRLPARPSLEQLHKQAKELLQQYRAGDHAAVERFGACISRLAGPGRASAAKLAEAQFVLAREYGYESWAKLKHHIQAIPDPKLEQFDRLARNLAAAYRSGDPEALERLGDLFGRSLTWEQLRGQVQKRLRTVPVQRGPSPSPTSPGQARPSPASRAADFTLADAQLFIARLYGFESWARFVESIGKPPTNPRSALHGLSSGPPFYQIDWKENKIEPRPPLSDQDWDEIFAVMKEMRITGLNATGQMGDAALEHLSQLDHVTHLNLAGSKRLTDTGLQQLASMPQLEHLDLTGCPITDRGLQVLRQLRELKSFHLYHNHGISDTGMASLAFCDQLERVGLLGTTTGDGAINALTGKHNLRHFKAGNQVTDAGLVLLHDFPVFKTWQGGESSIALMEFDAEPNYLLLRGSFTDKGLAGLVGLDGLFALNLDDSKLAVTAAGLKHLANLPNLGWLAFDAADEAMPHIAAMPRLRMLMCQDTVAGDGGFVALSRSKSIEYIWGRRCYNLTGRGFAALAAMPALRGLSVSCKNVDDTGLSALPRFPSLKEFMPMDVPDDGFRHVGRCGQLEALWCMYCNDTTDAATEHIAGLSGLGFYAAFSTQISDRSLEILSRMPSLERLVLYNCVGVTSAGIGLLARLPRLREISLEGLPNVTREAVTVFPASVRVNYSS